MRADRLVATLLVLQARGRVTAAEVALELEVSERTARRDLDALAASGIPVYSQQGRNGGWSLLGGSRTDLTGLTADEARALFLVAGPSSTATPEVKRALRKLTRALPEPFREGASVASEAMIIDSARWGLASAPSPPHLAALQRAVVSVLQARVEYRGRDGTISTRTIHPLGLVSKGPTWYLVAGTDAGQRTFRVDRLLSVDVLTERATRPESFDLDQEWKTISAQVDKLRAPLAATAIVNSAFALSGLRTFSSTRVTVVERRTDGTFLVEIRGMHANQIAGQIAAFGSAIEVIGPPAVRERLAELGRDLVARYEEGGGGRPAHDDSVPPTP